MLDADTGITCFDTIMPVEAPSLNSNIHLFEHKIAYDPCSCNVNTNTPGYVPACFMLVAEVVFTLH